ALKILRKQQPDGSWKHAGNKLDSKHYSLVETWKVLRYLIDQYEFKKEHPAIGKSCEYIFSFQTGEGDIRGILANQYAPYYTSALMYLLIKAGYAGDPRIERGFRWLLDMRQNDGGWVIGSPGMLNIPGLTRDEINDLTSNRTRETQRAFDKTKPFSAAGTGMVIRAFTVHPFWRKSEEAIKAANLLKSMFFRKDNWPSYEHPDNWIRFQFPFWWTNIVSALDSMSLMGIPMEDADIKNALQWLIDHQQSNGLWKVSYSGIHKAPENKQTYEVQLWLTLAICRIFKRFYS
ncbi:MAG: hypothetical protein NTV30_09375, partial [Chloroflexi bacterium]|nr:hypothetical protein [Chloroflexota bacterium]